LSQIVNQNLKTGILLTNLGTPDNPSPKAVRAYLKEFLLDPYVIQIPKPLWRLILHGFILPFRSRKSAKLYQKIWTPQGSPLLILSQQLVAKIQQGMSNSSVSFQFALGMRYGKPSIHEALSHLKQQRLDNLIILPLYPQFSNTTTGSTKNYICNQLKRLAWQPNQIFIDAYSTEPSYVAALAHTLQEYWREHPPGQKLIFSFHGIPQKHITRGDPYFDQCHTTARQVASLLHLSEQKWEVVFQSRFGKEKWLQPYAIDRLQTLPKEGYKHIDVICPGFAVDCLETLEEMAITNRELFLNSGGEFYNYIRALNDRDIHSQCLADILLRKALSHK
jgi:protoporphyrin/coproporphyrin ferrochelatase